MAHWKPVATDTDSIKTPIMLLAGGVEGSILLPKFWVKLKYARSVVLSLSLSS